MELLSEDILQILAERFKLLANATRLGILQHICEGERRVGELVDLTGFKQANVSKQLNLLAHAGIVRRRAEGTSVYYMVADDTLPKLCQIIHEGVLSRERELLERLQPPTP